MRGYCAQKSLKIIQAHTFLDTPTKKQAINTTHSRERTTQKKEEHVHQPTNQPHIVTPPPSRALDDDDDIYAFTKYISTLEKISRVYFLHQHRCTYESDLGLVLSLHNNIALNAHLSDS